MKKFLLLSACVSALSINFGSNAFSWSESKEELHSKVAEIKRAARSIPFCFYDEETVIMRALEEAANAKDPEDAKSKLVTIYSNVVGKNGSDRVLSKDVSVTKTREVVLESDPKKLPVTRRTYDELETSVRYRHEELLGRSDVRVIGAPRFPYRRHVVENTLWTFLTVGIYQVAHDYTAYINYVELTRRAETYQDTERKVHSLSKMRSLFLELFSLVSRQIENRNERRRRQAEEDARKRAAERKAEEARLVKVAAEKAEREQEIANCKDDGAKLNALGLQYFNGTDGKQKDDVHAVRLFELSHKAEHAIGSENYGRAHLWGWGRTKKDPQKAYVLFRDSFNRGYRLEANAPEDLKKHWNEATKALQEAERKAAEQARIEAARKKEIAECKDDGAKLNALGLQYLNGTDGKQKDDVHAVRLFELSHKVGHVLGSENYGRAHLFGWGGTKQDPQKASELFRDSFKRGYRLKANASEELKKHWNEATKDLQEEERKAAEDAKKAEEDRLAKEAADKAECERRAQEIAECGDDKEKLYALAEEYSRWIDGKVKDNKYAVELYKLAANQRHKQAAWSVTYAYFAGNGIDKDLDVAKEYACIAFNLGHRNPGDSAFAQFFQNATKDLQEAENERLAAEHKAEEERRSIELNGCGDDKEKIYQIALGYLSNSEDRKRDINYATTLLIKAYKAGHAGASERLSRICFHILRKEKTAAGYARVAFKLGHRNSGNSAFAQFFQNATKDLQEAEIERLSLLAKEQRNTTSADAVDVDDELRSFDKNSSEEVLYKVEEDTQSTRDSGYIATPARESISSTQYGVSTKTEPPTEAEYVPAEGESDSFSFAAELQQDFVADQSRRPLKAFVSEGRVTKSLQEQKEEEAKPEAIASDATVSLQQPDAPEVSIESDTEELHNQGNGIVVTRQTSPLSKLGWAVELFETSREEVANPEAFDVGVRMLINYGIKPADKDSVTGQTVQELIVQDGRLYKEWVEALEKYVHAKYLNVTVSERGEEAFFDALKELNADKYDYIDRELRTKVAEILNQYKTPIQGETIQIFKWDETMIRNWTSHYEKLDRAAKEDKIVELMAVIYKSVELIYKYSPRVTQLTAVLANLKKRDDTQPETGRFLQIATGEGKTVITAMTAAVLALWGDKVDIASSSEELCRRDGAKDGNQAKFYQLLTLDCADVAVDDAAQIIKGYQAPIVYGTIHAFSGHVLNQTFLGQKRRGERAFNVLLADEVDSLTIDQIDSFTQLSQPVCGSESLLSILALIHQQLDALIELPLSEDQIKEHLLNWSESLLQDPTQKALPVVEGQSLEIVVTDQLKAFVRYQLPIWIESAISARVNYKKERDHLVHTNGHIRPIDYQHTGVVHLNQVYSDGIHQYLQFKENSYVTPETVIGSFMSPLTYLGLYKNRIYGVTGTMGNEVARKFMSSVYGVDFMEIPTFKPKQFFEYTTDIQESQFGWTQSIVNSVEDETKRGRAVLVLCETKGQLESVIENIRDKN